MVIKCDGQIDRLWDVGSGFGSGVIHEGLESVLDFFQFVLPTAF
jgi:hypothetical protein